MDKIFLASPFFFVPSIILNNLITSSLCTNSIGTLFGFGSFYDTLIEYCGVGATLPIISFGHSLVDSAIECAKEEGFIPNHSANSLLVTLPNFNSFILFPSFLKN